MNPVLDVIKNGKSIQNFVYGSLAFRAIGAFEGMLEFVALAALLREPEDDVGFSVLGVHYALAVQVPLDAELHFVGPFPHVQLILPLLLRHGCLHQLPLGVVRQVRPDQLAGVRQEVLLVRLLAVLVPDERSLGNGVIVIVHRFFLKEIAVFVVFLVLSRVDFHTLDSPE